MLTLRRLRSWSIATTMAAVSLTCSGDDVIAPDPQPAVLARLAGHNQTGPINLPLPESLVVRVEDARGQPVGGVPVAWTVGGGGSLRSSSARSGDDGRVTAEWSLGGTAGPQTVTAAVADLTPVLFSATAEAGESPHLVITAQPSSVAQNAVPFVQQPVVLVVDGGGQPMGEGVPISVSASGGTLAGTTTVETGSSGDVQFTDLALSGPPGSYNLTFSATDYVSVQSTAITLNSAPGESGRLVITTQPSSMAQNGVPLVQQPVLRVEDAAGQPLGVGVPVTAAVDGATLAGTTTVESDGSGMVQFSDLALSGPNGSYNLTFSAPNFVTAQSTAIAIATTSAEGGQWTPPFSWPDVAVHMVLLPNEQVLSIGRSGIPQVWNPVTNAFTPVPAPARLFCAGHTLLSDGRVLVVGGHISDAHGLPNTTLFSPNAWTSESPMARGRWYPTATTMGNGDVVITGGTDESAANVPIPEVWSNGSLRQLTGASQNLPWYPRAFLGPNGSLYVAGPSVATRFLSVSGTGSWRGGPAHVFGTEREYGSAVMYDDGKILYAGGARTTNTAEVVDLNEPAPTWRLTGSMAHARRHHNLTVLPTGEVLATGGVNGTAFNDVSKGVHAAEIWNPATGQWTTLASNAVTRGYHGSSLLMPDGRVLNAGSGGGAGAPDELNAELYSPPYLFRGARPVITSAPSEVHYGDQFRIETPQAAAITHVSLVRLGAVTHAFDENQRFQRLSFTSDAGGLTVSAPTSSNRAPPGHYMLFVLNGADVPSVAKIVRIY